MSRHGPFSNPAGNPGQSFLDRDGTRNDLGTDGGPNGVTDDMIPVPLIVTTPSPAVGGQKAGALDDFGCFSFHAAKNMTTLGEGSMLTAKSDEDASWAPNLRHNGCCALEDQRQP